MQAVAWSERSSGLVSYWWQIAPSAPLPGLCGITLSVGMVTLLPPSPRDNTIHLHERGARTQAAPVALLAMLGAGLLDKRLR